MAPSPAKQGLSGTRETWLLEVVERGIRMETIHGHWLGVVESWTMMGSAWIVPDLAKEVDCVRGPRMELQAWTGGIS